MTLKEKTIIQQAINDLMSENGNFSDAIAKLCKLVGWHYPAGETLQKPLLYTSLENFLSTNENTKFKAPGYKSES